MTFYLGIILMQKLRVNDLVFYLTDAEHEKIKGVGQPTAERIQYLTEHCEVALDVTYNKTIKCRTRIETLFDSILM